MNPAQPSNGRPMQATAANTTDFSAFPAATIAFPSASSATRNPHGFMVSALFFVRLLHLPMFCRATSYTKLIDYRRCGEMLI